MQTSPEDDEDEEGGELDQEGSQRSGDHELHAAGEYWDEEDEIEEYFARKGVRNDIDGGSSSDESDEEGQGLGATKLGENPSLQDLNAETQRLLREVAGNDRLGRGQKIEIKPLSSIAEKLKKRRELAIARAPQRRNLMAVPNFEDILTAATANVDGGSQKPDGVVPKDPVASSDELEIVSEQEEEEPSAIGDGHPGLLPVFGGRNDNDQRPKTSPLIFDPYSQSRYNEDEFEDEPLIDDGLGSDDDSDSGSERSWEVRADDKSGDKDKNEDEDEDLEDEDEDKDDNIDEEEEGEVQEGEVQEVQEEASDRNQIQDYTSVPMNGLEAIMKNAQQAHAAEVLAGAKDLEGLTPAQLLAATDIIPPEMERLQKKLLDMEAELSDEEGAGVPVSDDEDENNLDDHGELADLITHDKVTDKDRQKAEDLHLQWARQKDAKDLQLVLRGLENGFRGRRGGAGLDGNDEELNGRWRRARLDDDDDYRSPIAAFAWPSAFAMGGNNNGNNEEEACEDDIMLHKAKQQRLIRQETAREVLSTGPIPLDDDSRMFLDLLARSANDSQQDQCPLQKKGRTGSAVLRPQVAKPSFVGRQSLASKKSGSSGLLGPTGGRSFVFGKSDNSNSSNVQDESAVKNSSDTGKDENVGPTNFANLRQLAGLPGSSNRGQKVKESKKSLVSRLKSQSSLGAIGSQESLAAVQAVCKLANDTQRTIAK